MINFLFNPYLFLYFVAPSALIGGIAGFARNRNTTASSNRKAIKTALIAAILSFIEFGIYIIYAISKSTNSTAILGIIEIPFSGIPLAILTFVLVWAISLLFFEKFSKTSIEIIKKFNLKKSLAIFIFLVFVILQTTQGYSIYLIQIAQTSNDSNKLRQIYENAWAKLDPRILNAIAKNEKTTGDILDKLSLDTRGYIQSSIARNPSTPVETLRFMYENHGPKYSSSYVLFDLAVNPNTPPEILLELSKSDDDVVRSNLTHNSNLPAELLCQLTNRQTQQVQFDAVSYNAQKQIKTRNISCP